MGVDIVVRTKDRPAFLARALDDVLAQTVEDWTVVLVNDGGHPDPVDAAVARRPALDGRVRVVHLPVSLGRGGALNRGIDACRSSLLAWHDDDDTWHPDFLARTVSHLNTHDHVAVAVRTEIVWERLEGDQYVELDREIFHPRMIEPTYFDQLRFNHIVPIALLYRRAMHDAVGPVDIRLRSVSDWDFYLRLWRAGEVGFIDEVLAYWHQRPDESGTAGNSVIAEHDSHILHDRRVRDHALRDHAHDGDLLHLTNFIDERFGELNARLDRLESGYAQARRRSPSR